MDTIVFPDDMPRDQKISSLKELVQIALVELSDLKSEFNKFKNPKEDFYTVDEITAILKVTKQSIYNKIHAGRAGISIPPYIKLGNLIRFKVSDYSDWYANL